MNKMVARFVATGTSWSLMSTPGRSLDRYRSLSQLTTHLKSATPDRMIELADREHMIDASIEVASDLELQDRVVDLSRDIGHGTLLLLPGGGIAIIDYLGSSLSRIGGRPSGLLPEDAGLPTRRSDPDDARRSLVSLTPHEFRAMAEYLDSIERLGV